jgi:hypothetical protein
MDILDSILENWNKNKDVGSLISEGLFTDETAIQSSLEKLTGQQKAYAFSQLEEIESAIRTYIEGIDQEKKGIKKQLDATLKSAKACLSYGSSIDIQNKGRE